MTVQQPALFEDAKPCPQPGCAAIRLPGQTEPIPTCAHDLHRDNELRPKGCLNAGPLPATTPIPYA